MASVEQLVLDLSVPEKREHALAELSKKRESCPDLAPMLWHSYGSLAALLQEIVSIYPQLNPPVLSNATSNRVCNALALLQCLASHQETRGLFLAVRSIHVVVSRRKFKVPLRTSSQFPISLSIYRSLIPTLFSPHSRSPPHPPWQSYIPLYLYPFLSTTSKARPFEYLRLTSLGVIGALVKVRTTKPLTRFHC